MTRFPQRVCCYMTSCSRWNTVGTCPRCSLLLAAQCIWVRAALCVEIDFFATGTLAILEPRVLNSNHCVLLFGMSYWLSPGFHWWEWNIVASTVFHTKNRIHLKTNNLCKVIQRICSNVIIEFVPRAGDITAVIVWSWENTVFKGKDSVK